MNNRKVIVQAGQQIIVAKSKPEHAFTAQRWAIEDAIGFQLSKGTKVDLDAEDKVLNSLLAVAKRWAKRNADKKIATPDEAIEALLKDKRTVEALRGLFERKAAGVVTGEIRLFIALHRNDPASMLVEKVLGSLDQLFTPEELQEMMKGKTFVYTWVGRMTQHNSKVLLLTQQAS